MKSKKIPKKLPKRLHKYFWDVDVNKLNLDAKRYFIIQRLLDKGNLEAIDWVRENYKSRDIRYALVTFRDFSLKSASFWGLLYNIPLSQIKCFQEPYLTTRKTLWPY